MKALFLVSALLVSNFALASGGEIESSYEKCAGVAKNMAKSLVKEANVSDYDYQALNQKVTLNNGRSVLLTYDQYTYEIGEKGQVGSSLDVVLDSECNFVQAKRNDNI